MEQAVAHGVEDHVCAAGLGVESQGHEQGVQALHHAAGGHDAQNGLEDAGNGVDEGVKQALFLGRGLLGGGRAVSQARHGAHVGVDLRHVVADDHLILSAGLHDGHHTAHLFQYLVVCLCLVRKLEPQAGDAVGQGADVFVSAHVLDDVLCQLLILSHLSTSINSGLEMMKV